MAYSTILHLLFFASLSLCAMEEFIDNTKQPAPFGHYPFTEELQVQHTLGYYSHEAINLLHAIEDNNKHAILEYAKNTQLRKNVSFMEDCYRIAQQKKNKKLEQQCAQWVKQAEGDLHQYLDDELSI